MRWCVAKVKPQQEDRALENLQNQAFHAFLPLLRERRRREVLLKPMFPGYIFIEIEQGDVIWKRINSTRGVLRLMLNGEERPSLVPRGVIEDFIEQGGVVDHFEDTVFFKVGDRVRFTEGAFHDQEGVCQWSSENMVHLLLSILGRETLVYCNPGSLKLIAPQALSLPR